MKHITKKSLEIESVESRLLLSGCPFKYACMMVGSISIIHWALNYYNPEGSPETKIGIATAAATTVLGLVICHQHPTFCGFTAQTNTTTQEPTHLQ